MLFRMIYDGFLSQAAYLIGCQKTGEAILVDPQRDADRYIKAAEAEKMRIVAVAETHIHADFMSGAREMADRTGATVYVSDEGAPEWRSEWVTAPTSKNIAYKHVRLHDGDTFRIGNIEFTVLHTPGHTPEHICYLVTDHGGGASEPMGILSGDFVFVGDMGRPDLLETAAGQVGVKEMSAVSLFESAQRFKALPDWLQVWPAHGAGSACGKALGAVPQSTVGYERRFNPALMISDDRSEFVRSILEGQPEPPLYFARMKRENKIGPKVLGTLPKPRELQSADVKSLDGRSTAILDTRPWAAFKAGHIAGALHAPFNNSFCTVAGSYVNENEPICLLVASEQLDEAVRCLIRIGLDRIDSYMTPATLQTAVQAGLALKPTMEIDVKALNAQLASAGGETPVLDVRRAGEFEAGHIDGALNIAHTRLKAHLDQVPKGKPVIVHCQGGTRSAFATALLQRHGIDAVNVAGGFGAWEKAGFDVVRETADVK